MNRKLLLIILTCVVTGALLPAVAQEAAQPSAETEPQVDSSSRDVVVVQSVSPGSQSEDDAFIDIRYTTPPLVIAPYAGDSILSAVEHSPIRLFVGGSISESWDDQFAQLPGVSKSSTLFNPFVAVTGSTSRTRYVGQYTSTISRYAGVNGQVTAFHRGSFDIAGDISQKWSWTANFGANYGNDVLQLAESARGTMSGGVAIGDGTAAFSAPVADSIFGLKEGLALVWRPSVRDSWNFSMSHAYYSIGNQDASTNQMQFAVNYQHSLSRRASIQAYGDFYRPIGTDECSSFGGGLGFTYQPNAATTIEAAGGPETSSTGCSRPQVFGFRAAATRRLSTVSKAYLSVRRQHTLSPLLPAMIDNTVSAGYDRTFGRRVNWQLDGGYLRGDSSVLSGHYRGYFVSTDIRIRTAKGITVIVSARRFDGAANGPAALRNMVLFTIEFSPKMFRLR